MTIRKFKLTLLFVWLLYGPTNLQAQTNTSSRTHGREDANKVALEKRTDENVQQLFFGKQIQALQLRYFPKRHRVGLSVGGAYNLNDPLQHHIGVGGTLRFHLSERWGIGARYFAYRNIDKTVRHQLKNQLNLFPERTDIRMEGQVMVNWSPIDGKFTFFDAGISYYDVYFSVGAGALQNFAQNLLPTALVGLGVRFYLTQWMGLELEFNDTLYIESYPDQSTLLQNLTVGLSITLYMPFSPDYQTVPDP